MGWVGYSQVMYTGNKASRARQQSMNTSNKAGTQQAKIGFSTTKGLGQYRGKARGASR